MSAGMRLRQGQPWPLGATVQRDGAASTVNFAVFSERAQRVELCLFDPTGRHETARMDLPEATDGVFHGLLPHAGAGTVYGYRVHGARDARRGDRFNPAKLLLDPYARALAGQFKWSDAHLGDVFADDVLALRDNSADMFKAVVAPADSFDWGDDAPPRTAWSDTVIYEAHVGGLSRRHPQVDSVLRGTFAGMGSAPIIEHLRRLGVTAVDLLPVQQHLDELPLVRRGMTNYWGYNTLGFFIPDQRFAHADPVNEFKAMVRALHAGGIEVILDVVYNHTAEGDQRGPTLSWRGFDNASWYRLRREDARFYENHSGTGNSMNIAHPRVLQFVLDSLRFWVEHMHVDGFRFDLAASLGRGDAGFDPRAALFQAIAQDPVLACVKLIAEPWDLGPDGYQLGRFPAGWSEWNDRYRDASRAFWIRKTADRGQIASRIAGSSDIFARNGRDARASINFICAHDGFTLHDLVSYDRKRNHANGEDNRDGTDANSSWNCGVEGPSELLAINALRARIKRALVGTLLLSKGVPMLLAGDEIGRTQQGNNNAYNQDNELSWLDWQHRDDSFFGFVAKMVALRKRLVALRGLRWYADGTAEATPSEKPNRAATVRWLNRLGEPMTRDQWQKAERFVFGMHVVPPGLGAVNDAGTVPTSQLLLLFNAQANDWRFPLPDGDWRELLDTALVDPFERDGLPASVTAGESSLSGSPGTVIIKARSVAVFEFDQAVSSKGARQ